jgi:hypothetical protein
MGAWIREPENWPGPDPPLNEWEFQKDEEAHGRRRRCHNLGAVGFPQFAAVLAGFPGRMFQDW